MPFYQTPLKSATRCTDNLAQRRVNSPNVIVIRKFSRGRVRVVHVQHQLLLRLESIVERDFGGELGIEVVSNHFCPVRLHPGGLIGLLGEDDERVRLGECVQIAQRATAQAEFNLSAV